MKKNVHASLDPALEPVREKVLAGRRLDEADGVALLGTRDLFTLGELANLLTTAQMAVDGMVAITNDWDFEPTPETVNAVLIRKTIAAKAIISV